ncbi:MAG: cation diffusion facilitator family transporter [Planctomycetota bacterium]|nr:cation diffusion facilitator family transporter [Planctomycetota bacterium]
MSCHSHGHDHCGHSHSTTNRNRLLLTLVLAAGYMVAEVVGGLISNSLALLADAGHMFSDVASLGLSVFAIWISSRPAGSQRTFGYYRAEILAALVNGATLVVVSFFIVYEAWQRVSDPPDVQGGLMMWIAVGGLVVNLFGLAVLHGGKEHSLNVRGAWLHVLSDTLGSVAAIVAGLLIQNFGWYIADPIISAVISVLVLVSAWRLVSDSVWVLMQAAPANISVPDLETALAETSGVLEVHDLHVWTITSGMDSVSCHIVSDGTQPHDELLQRVRDVVIDRFSIDHVTIQIEPEGFLEPHTPV